MSKGLPIMGIVAAVFALLGALVLVPQAPPALLTPLVAIVGGVLLIMERNLAGRVSAGLVFVVSIIALLGQLGSVSTGDGSGNASGASFGIDAELAAWLSMASCLLVVGGLVWSRWGAMHKPWLAYTSAALPALALVVGLIGLDEITNQQEPLTLVTGVLCLASILPGILHLRSIDVDH